MEITIKDIRQFLDSLGYTDIVGIPRTSNDCLVARAFRKKYPDNVLLGVNETYVHSYADIQDNFLVHNLNGLVKDFDTFGIPPTKAEYLQHLDFTRLIPINDVNDLTLEENV